MSKYLNVGLDDVIKLEGGARPYRFFRNKNNHNNNLNKTQNNHGNSGVYRKAISKPFSRERPVNKGGEKEKRSVGENPEKKYIERRDFMPPKKIEKEPINKNFNVGISKRIVRNESEIKDSRVIKINNLATNVEISELFELLEPCGKILNISFTWDHLESKDNFNCYAVVEFKEFSGAKSAIEQFNGAELDGEVLEVIYLHRN